MAALTTVEILRVHDLRPTEGRKEILDVIRQSKCALSHPEIDETPNSPGSHHYLQNIAILQEDWHYTFNY